MFNFGSKGRAHIIHEDCMRHRGGSMNTTSKQFSSFLIGDTTVGLYVNPFLGGFGNELSVLDGTVMIAIRLLRLLRHWWISQLPRAGVENRQRGDKKGCATGFDTHAPLLLKMAIPLASGCLRDLCECL